MVPLIPDPREETALEVLLAPVEVDRAVEAAELEAEEAYFALTWGAALAVAEARDVAEFEEVAAEVLNALDFAAEAR